MTPETAKLVQHSFQRLIAARRLTGEDFIVRLLDAAPRAASHIPAGAADERRRLMAVLAFTIEALDDFEVMRPALRVAGARYRDLGVGPVEYAQFGAALMRTLEAEFGRAWTLELRAAWSEAYSAITSTMQTVQEDALTAA
ncbi:MAG TPA: globin domain-containing protein [Thermohalobaculum sp.]|nr:globin domain-containing protein [Thermohalobaculum sp.]